MYDHPRLKIDRVRAAPDHELRLIGVLTADTTPSLHAILDQLLDLSAPQVWSMTLDLAGVTAVDGTGIAGLCEIQEAMIGRGGDLAVLHPSEAVRRALMISRFGHQKLETQMLDTQKSRNDESSSPRSTS
jgi:anti-anti-sigma regulatory factor